MTAAPTPGRLVRVAARLQCTEGQVYSMVLGVAAAILLSLLALPGVTWRVREAAATPVIDAAPSSGTDSVDPVSTDPGSALISASTTPPSFSVQPDGATTSTTGRPYIPPAPREPAPEVPCPARAVVDAAEEALPPIDEAAGGVVPSAGLVGLVAQATGCTNENVLITILGLVVDIGKGLPDPLGGTPQVLPPLTPLGEVAGVVQPLVGPLTGPVVGSLCTTVSTVATLHSVLFAAYPWPIMSADMTNLLYYATLACAAIGSAG